MELDVQNLSFGYIKKPLCLTNINFKLTAGDVAVFLGGEGMGKTSLLKVLCGLENQYVGFVKINGKDMKEIQSSERRISYLPSEPVFLESKTVLDNLNFLFEVEKIEPYSKEKIQEIFDKFSFKNQLGDKVKKLSLFEKRLLAIIRCYIKNSNLILIDEQTEGLNKENINIIKNAISTLYHDKNTSKIIVLCCNNANLIDLANKYYYISYAKLSEFKTEKKLKDECVDLFALNYFDFKLKKYLLSKEENTYCLNDYKINYKNPKKQKGEMIEYLEKIKIDNSFNEILDKVGLLDDEELKVVLVNISDEGIVDSDAVYNKMIKNKKYLLFEEDTGVKIL